MGRTQRLGRQELARSRSRALFAIASAALLLPHGAHALEPTAVEIAQVELSDAFDAPLAPEQRSIATQWATAPMVARSPECDGCLRLTTTPRAPRPPVHSYVFTELAGGSSDVRGGYGGHVLAERLLLGGGGFGLARLLPLSIADGVPANAQRDALGAGGFFGALLLPRALMQPVASLFVGVGNLRYKIDATEPYPAAKVLIVAPQFTLEAETVNQTRFGVGANYRVVEGSPIARQLTRDVAGPSVFGFVLFGFR
jgi:hypothetical protein